MKFEIDSGTKYQNFKFIQNHNSDLHLISDLIFKKIKNIYLSMKNIEYLVTNIIQNNKLIEFDIIMCKFEI